MAIVAETTPEAPAEAKRRGRPRDPGRDTAIMQAARQVIAEQGYTGASMEEIARVAGVGKDTLYRRWTSKEALTIDLIGTLAREGAPPKAIDPDPKFNLLMFLKDVARLNQRTEFGQIVAGVVGESFRNPDLAHCFRQFWESRRAIAAELVRDVVGTDATDDEISVILDRLLGPIYYRLLITGQTIDDEFLWDLVVNLPSPNPPTERTPQ